MAKHKFEMARRGDSARQGRQSKAAKGGRRAGHDKTPSGVSKVPDKERAKPEATLDTRYFTVAHSESRFSSSRQRGKRWG